MTSASRPRLCGAAAPRPARKAGIGAAAGSSTSSTPSAMRWRFSRRSASTRTRFRSSPAARRSCIRAVRRPSSSGQRRSSDGSDNCTRAHARRSTPRDRSSLSRSRSTLFPRPKRSRPRPSRSSIRSDFMAVERDLAFVVGEPVSAGDILKAAESAERALVAKVGVFDVYRGEGVAEGAKSIAIHVTPATARTHADRRRNRRRNVQDRGRGVEEDRRDAQELKLMAARAAIALCLCRSRLGWGRASARRRRHARSIMRPMAYNLCLAQHGPKANGVGKLHGGTSTRPRRARPSLVRACAWRADRALHQLAQRAARPWPRAYGVSSPLSEG